jgi:NADH-quinone oxidoreductase subunit N
MTYSPPSPAWLQIAPVAIPLIAGILGVLIEVIVPRRMRRPVQIGLTLLAMIGSIVAIAMLWNDVAATGGEVVWAGNLVLDGPTLVAQAVIAITGLLAVLIIADRTEFGEDHFTPMAAAEPGSVYESVARRRGLTQTEMYPLTLFALGGMMLFPAAGNLLTLFVALEVFSLPLYLLTGLARRARLLSQEASLKYFVLGAFASAFLLFGVAMLYGYAGSVRYADISYAVQIGAGDDLFLIVGVVLVLIGLLFKVGAVPFHMWTPDVYQGAPTPITGFMAAGTKVAAFGAMLRFVYLFYPAVEWDLSWLMWGIAILTMIVGTVLGIVQTDVKRMLAYSAIAHAGFILVGVLALTESGISGSLFYLAAYGVASVGAFGVISLVRQTVESDDPEGDRSIIGEATKLPQWAGLGKRHPWIAVVFLLFLLSFAGIPLTSGFTAKFVVFAAAFEGGVGFLAVVGVLASAAAAFFYFRLIVLMFFTEPTEVSEGTTVVRTEGLTVAAVGVCAAITVVLGVFPQPVLDLIAQVAQFIR